MHWSNLVKGFHASGTLRHGRKIYGYYHKFDSVTEENKQKLQERFPHAEWASSRLTYSPEQVSKVIIFPAKAELKRREDSNYNFYPFGSKS